jgi:ArsR family transcriptional regulator, arsenate/arsenite/antimonite-responsive transcriptional repressor
MSERPLTPRQALACCSPLDEGLDAELFKALSDPTRLALLACLAKCGRECSVTEIAECCSVDFSVVSRHLALLERAGVLQSAKRGRAVFYQVRYGHVAGALRRVADALDACGPAAACCVPCSPEPPPKETP